MVPSPRIDNIRRISDGGGFSFSSPLRNQSIDKDNNKNNHIPSRSVVQDVPSISSTIHNGTRFRSNPHSLVQITTHKPVIHQEDRPTIKKDLQRFRESTTEKFSKF